MNAAGALKTFLLDGVQTLVPKQKWDVFCVYAFQLGRDG